MITASMSRIIVALAAVGTEYSEAHSVSILVVGVFLSLSAILMGPARVGAQDIDGYWTVLTNDVNEIGGTVYAIEDDFNGQLIVGGQFQSASGSKVNSIARWNGEKWESLDGGVTEGPVFGSVFSLVSAGGRLYVGGKFLRAGSIDARSIAAWDGSRWEPLGEGLVNRDGSPVRVMAMVPDDNGGIYVAGKFNLAGGLPANNVARWDGFAWTSLGAGVSGQPMGDFIQDGVSAIARDSLGSIYVGGVFTSAGGTEARRIAVWDGQSWSSLGTGIDGSESPGVYALEHDGSSLYVGGFFNSAGGVAASNIARWDGGIWEPLGEGVCYRVKSMSILDGKVFLGAPLDCSPDFGEWRYGMMWDGSELSAMDAGISAPITALEAGMGRTYVGGGPVFNAGGTTTSGVAVWVTAGSSKIDADSRPGPMGLRFDSIYPNPFSGSMTIGVSAQQPATILLSVSDLQGRRVHFQRFSLQSGMNWVRWTPAASLASGRYILEARDLDGMLPVRDQAIVLRLE